MRNRGLGRVYQRGRIWWIQYCFRGKVYRESSGSARRIDAVRLLAKGEMGRGRLIGPSVERTAFDDLARILLNDYRANERKSLRRAELSLAALRRYLGTLLARDITTDRLNEYIAARRDTGRKAATIRNELAALRRAFRLAEAEGKAISPHFPTLSVNNTRTGFFERSEFEAIAARLSPDVRPIAEFAFLTGWREGEIRALQWRQIDFEADVVRLDPGATKNGEGRVFPFATLPQLSALLRSQQARTDAIQRNSGRIIPWVFNRNGAPIKSFREGWKSACEGAGLPNKLMHDFRRTAVRNLERAGVSRSVAMKITGHKTESVYRRYAIVSESDLAEGVTKLAALHAREPREAARVEPLRGRIDTVLAQSGHSADEEAKADAG